MATRAVRRPREALQRRDASASQPTLGRWRGRGPARISGGVARAARSAPMRAGEQAPEAVGGFGGGGAAAERQLASGVWVERG